MFLPVNKVFVHGVEVDERVEVCGLKIVEGVGVQVVAHGMGDLPVRRVEKGQVPVVPPEGPLLVEEVVCDSGAHTQHDARCDGQGPGSAGIDAGSHQCQESQNQAVL